jgi:glycosyltransferase involved in cell wall biosynthesis
MASSSDPEFPVLLVASRFQARGSSSYTLRMLEHLPELGIEAQAVSPDASMVDKPLRDALRIREYPALDSLAWGRIVQRRVARDIANRPPRLIHVQTRRMLATGNWLAKRLQRPFLVTVHDHLPPGASLTLDPHWCAGVIAVSQSVADNLVSQGGVPSELVHVITSGVETHLDAAIMPLLAEGKVPVVGTAGPLEAIKGFPFLLGAARQVLSTGRDAEFLVAGAGPEEANLRRLARELGIADKVTFVPYLLNFTESMAATDVFVLPSLQQGLGTVLLEAMSLGRPVIASDVGGIHCILRDGENGLSVPPSNSAALAHRILELLDDPARARRLGNTAREFVQREFGVEQMVRRTVEFYHSAVHRATPAPMPGK